VRIAIASFEHETMTFLKEPTGVEVQHSRPFLQLDHDRVLREVHRRGVFILKTYRHVDSEETGMIAARCMIVP